MNFERGKDTKKALDMGLKGKVPLITFIIRSYPHNQKDTISNSREIAEILKMWGEFSFKWTENPFNIELKGVCYENGEAKPFGLTVIECMNKNIDIVQHQDKFYKLPTW